MSTINQLLMKHDAKGAYFFLKREKKVSVYLESPFKTLTTFGESENCTYDVYLSYGEFVLINVEFPFNFEKIAKNIKSTIGWGYIADVTARDNKAVISVKREFSDIMASYNHQLKGGTELISFELKISDDNFRKILTTAK